MLACIGLGLGLFFGFWGLVVISVAAIMVLNFKLLFYLEMKWAVVFVRFFSICWPSLEEKADRLANWLDGKRQVQTQRDATKR